MFKRIGLSPKSKVSRSRLKKKSQRRIRLEALESRKLLAASIFLSNNGQLQIIGDSTAADEIAVSYDAGQNRYTFTNNAPITVNTTNGASDVDGTIGDNSATVDVDDFTVALNRLRFALRGGDDDLQIDGFGTNGEGLQVIDGNGIDSTSINADLGTGASRIGFALVTGESLSVSADVFAGVTGITFTAPTTLVGNTSFDSTGTVTLNDTVDGAADLTIQGFQVIVNSDIGSVTPIGNFSATATSTQVAIGDLGASRQC